MNREEFIKVIGHEPEQDDLERANCKLAGLGHWACGVCERCRRPRFTCTCTVVSERPDA
ncbi:hypothetical protein LCGC14_1472370 [marine sediment metagenome]|uniref:Uncharacterized protein n=1 Tax=marine sediment metagenome TaxID=412755 RepID=A0A0F9JXZ4_9ZZZZ